ncbi:UDP-glucose 4-epimerase GalE [Hylemonella sp. W303a]|uniref:UDP-glucose 4-epimerase GalE n=1 Tax=Hylemonella sp. W303a TaxID=3389873 RepID=UPI00396B46DE
MNILLTGGSGYIGSHAAVALAQAGHKVVLYDNLSNSQLDVVSRVGRILGYPLVLIEGDVRAPDLLGQALREHSIDAVVHFAGLKAVGESVAQPLTYYDNNVTGTQCLLRAMHRCGVRTLVFSSSATVYGEPRYLPLDERHPTSAVNPYGRSKLHIEEMLSDLALSDASWRIACLRYFNPVGAHESGLIGEDPNGIPNNLMPYIAQVATGRRDRVSVFGGDYETPDGTGVRDYIHVTDLAHGHLAALNFLASASGVGWHAFNLGTGKGHSVLEVIQAFERASGMKVPYEIVARRAGDVASSYASSDKARHMLGWQAKLGLDEMCASAWRWQRYCAQL